MGSAGNCKLGAIVELAKIGLNLFLVTKHVVSLTPPKSCVNLILLSGTRNSPIIYSLVLGNWSLSQQVWA